MAKPKPKPKSPKSKASAKERAARAASAAPLETAAVADALPVTNKAKGTGAGTGKDTIKDGTSAPNAPGAPHGNTLNLALPFSKIEVQEPSGELIELATLLSDLLVALAEWVPEETLSELRTRAQSLASRLSP